MKQPKFPSSFEPIESSEEPQFPSSFEPIKEQAPATFKGAAQAYGTGLGGGAGGIAGDVSQLLGYLSSINPGFGLAETTGKASGVKGTQEQTQALQQEFGANEPQNALERILQHSGQFGGQEGVIGTALGGPVGGGLGVAHGSASGALYGGLKELGIPDEYALGITAFATVSPIAAERFLTKLKADKAFKEALKTVEKEIPQAINPSKSIPPGEPPSPPPPPGGIGPGTVLPETKSLFSEKEKILEKLSEHPKGEKLGVEAEFPIVKGEAKPLQGRVSEAQELGRAVSKEAFETEAQAGREIAKDVREVRDAERNIVRDKYKAAEEVTKTHDDIYPSLAFDNEARISRLEELEKRSTAQEAVYKDAIALRSIIGTPEALRQANAGKLMDQANSFSQKVNYELEYAGSKAAIKDMVHQMNKSVIESLEKSGKNAALVKEADKTYSRFADRFMADEISPYLQKKILNSEQLARRAISDEASYRAVKDAIGSRKSPLINKLDREIVHQKMDKYYKDLEQVGSKQYTKDLKNLSELVGKEKIADIDHFLRQKQLNFEKKLLGEKRIKEAQLSREKLPGKGHPTKISERISKESVAKTPEELDKLFRSRSDIRRLRRSMKDKGLERDFEKLAEHKIEEIFKEGGFGSKKVTGRDLERIIDKEHEVLSELLGEEELSLLYKAARAAGKEELTQDIIKTVLKGAGKLTLQFLGLGKIIKLLPLRHI